MEQKLWETLQRLEDVQQGLMGGQESRGKSLLCWYFFNGKRQLKMEEINEKVARPTNNSKKKLYIFRMWEVAAESLWILVGLPDRHDNSTLHWENLLSYEAASPSESRG